MKVTAARHKPEFRPVTVTIRLDTPEEARALRCLAWLNVSASALVAREWDVSKEILEVLLGDIGNRLASHGISTCRQK